MSTAISARLVTAIGDVWSAIRCQHPDVPDVMVSVGAGRATKNGLTLGHFAAAAWQAGEQQVSELFVGGEGLISGAEELLVTLIHEAAHGVAHSRGIKDTSRQGRYHNERYSQLAQEVGLVVTKDARMGWSPSQLAEGTAAAYAPELAQLTAALVVHRRTFGRAADEDRPSNNNGAAAVCGCQRKIRVSETTLDLGPIICGLCGQPFTASDSTVLPTANSY